MDRDIPEYLESLNSKQRDAVLYNGSSLLILAGAGSGKTRVITTRIAYLIDQLGVDPYSILAVTFTNKAAREMSERLVSLVPEAEKVMIRTFHSFGAWLLRRNAHLAGLDTRFSIYDDDDGVTLLQSIYADKAKKDLVPFSRAISRAKDYCLNPDDDLSSISYDPGFAEAYRRYEEKKSDTGNADFGDLIKKPMELLRDNEELRRRIQGRFRYLLVDEYQDSNVAQYELLKALKGPENNVCVVGDDDQSIYRFRGAEVKNILTFADTFPETEVIRLEQNYRSTQNILKVASEVVQNNEGRLGKTLWTENEEGPLPQVSFLSDQDDEAAFCAKLLKDRRYGGTAILYRTNAQSLAFEQAFVRKGIPYKIVGSLQFYEREEVKDVLALLALLVNPRDEIAFRRIVNKPARGIGKATVEKIVDIAPSVVFNLLDACSRFAETASTRSRNAALGFIKIMENLVNRLETMALSDFINLAIQEAGFLEYYQKQDEIALTQKTANLNELVNGSVDYSDGMEGLVAFLEDLELDRSRMAAQDNQDDNAVTLITMHNTKGLEFDRVIISGMEQALFPGSRVDYSDTEALEEERRIFYVSITRARKELYLTSCRRRRIWGQWKDMAPSVFIEELPGDFVDGVQDKVQAADDGYPPGQGIYHDDYGSGVVVKSWHNGTEHMVLVRFESGRTAQFIPKYTPLEKISSDFF